MAKVNHLKVFSCAFLSLVIPVASMETNPLRDFSKLRLEPASASSNTEDYTSSSSTTSRTSSLPSSPSYGGGYNGDFKPSYNDNQMDSYSEIEPGSNNNELYDSSPMIPSMPPNRPLLHNDGDESLSSGGPNFFSSPQNNPGSNMDKSGGGGQNPEDLFFIPQPPSQSFLAEVEYDSGISASTIPEKGMGGIFDDEEDSGDNPEGGEGEGSGNNENQDEYYGNQGGPYGQENSEDGRRGYGGGGGGGGGPEGGRYNSFGGSSSGSSDYGDY